MTSMRFADRVVVITGGSLGIGEAAARQFAREGARVAIASRDPDNAANAVNAIAGAGGSAVHVRTDLAQDDDIAALARDVRQRFGRVDVLVNNAAIHMQGDAETTSPEDWDRVMAINLRGAFLCTHHFAPDLAARKGVIVNVSSEAGLVGIRGQVAYNVSKAGLIALTRSCAVDFAARGIRVNCVCPGTTSTPLVDAIVKRAKDPAATQRHLESIRPLDRLGTSDEIASAIVYLASDEAAYATGAILSMDGGYTAQ
jgi:NAD(P)-dependent dehydrogenase (short-subunit alcohol dehydrogenase family)